MGELKKGDFIKGLPWSYLDKTRAFEEYDKQTKKITIFNCEEHSFITIANVSESEFLSIEKLPIEIRLLDILDLMSAFSKIDKNHTMLRYLYDEHLDCLYLTKEECTEYNFKKIIDLFLDIGFLDELKIWCDLYYEK